MCGISGLIDLQKRLGRDTLQAVATRMAQCMAYRGPDDQGVWVDASNYCAFSHVRLSIIDTSSAGHQPMLSSDNKVTICFNGEIYNYAEVKEDLVKRGCRFNTRTDTEVLIEAFRMFGTESLVKLDGQYAFAYFDTETKNLWLARDPFGEKPLYYTFQNGIFAFASEMHALSHVPQFDATLDPDAIAQFFAFQYVPSPRALYRSVKKLPPGHWLKFSPDGTITIKPHFTFRPEREPVERPIPELADELEDILIRSLRRRLISDVPLGAFLSGGVDSSAVVALITKVLGVRMKTFSIGFEGTAESEHVFARQMAHHLNSDHYERMVSPDALDLSKHLGQVLDEPNADSSCLPTYLLSQLAREQVTVAISGDGGDEMFAGYPRYFVTLDEEARANEYDPHYLHWSPGQVYYSSRILVFLEEHLKDLLGDIPEETIEFLKRLRSDLNSRTLPLVSRLRRTDVENYMPGAVLSKVDRMSMQHSLEVRTPILSREVARFAERLAPTNCYNAGQGKLVLKELASRYIPRAWLDRNKMGFGLPMNRWGRDAFLRELKRVTLSQDSCLQLWIDKKNIERFISRLEQGSGFPTYQAWTFLILEQWLRSHVVKKPEVPIFQGRIRPLTINERALRDPPLSLPANTTPLAASMRSPIDAQILERQGKPISFFLVGDMPELCEHLPNLCQIVRFKQAGGANYPCDYRTLTAFDVELKPCTGGVAFFDFSRKYIPAWSLKALEEAGYTELLTPENGRLQSTPVQKENGSSAFRQWRTRVSTSLQLFLRKLILRQWSVDFHDAGVGEYEHHGGNNFLAPLPQLQPWLDKGKGVLLFEEHIQLTPCTYRDEVRIQGQGRFCHSGPHVYFSSTDNSNPAHNGRRYRYLVVTGKKTLLRPFFSKQSIFTAPQFSPSLRVDPRFKRLEETDQKFYEAAGKQISSTAPVGYGAQGRIANEVCLFISSLAPGGAERQLCYIARALTKRKIPVRVILFPQTHRENLHYQPLLDEMGVPVSLIAEPHKDFQMSDLLSPSNREQFELLRMLPERFGRDVWNLFTHLWVHKPRVLHCWLDYPNLVGGIAGWLAGTPRVVLSTRNANPSNFAYIYEEWQLRWYRLLAKCSRVHFSGNSKEGNRSYADWIGIPQESYSLVHNGLNTVVIKKVEPSARQKVRTGLGIPMDAPVVAGVFRLNYEKRPFLFIRTVAKLKERIPNLRAVLVGVGPLADQVKNEIHARGLDKTILVLGRREDVPAIIYASDMLLLTSAEEGMPNVLMEAQWLERPVVSTAVGGVPEVVQDGVTGFVCPKDDFDALEEKSYALLTDEGLRRRLGQAGRPFIEENFSLERLVNETVALYGLPFTDQLIQYQAPPSHMPEMVEPIRASS